MEEARKRVAPYLRKCVNLPIRKNFGNHVTVRPTDRPSTLQAYQCKLAQSTGMATQMQLEDISPGNRIATRVL